MKRNQKPVTSNQKILLSGNEAVAQGAIDAGCRFYAGYPITPQNELIGYMAKNMASSGGIFIQSESELSAINMVFGASASGVRAMTSSSSPGISLMQEGISYIAGAELPAVIVNIMRAGPGLGNIWPAQSDYFQSVKGGGQGDYHCIVLAPSSVQEAYALTFEAFVLADKYRIPAIILGDAMLGQMMEPLSVVRSSLPAGRQASSVVRCGIRNTEYGIRKEWAATGCKGRKPNVVKSFYLNLGDLEKFNLKLQKKYKNIKRKEQRYEELNINDARIILVAYGTMARLAKQAMASLREKGVKVGLIRPINLWPFPQKIFQRLAISDTCPSGRRERLAFLVIEMSYGQMLEDVKLAVNGRRRVEFLGRAGGGIPSEKEIINKIISLAR